MYDPVFASTTMQRAICLFLSKRSDNCMCPRCPSQGCSLRISESLVAAKFVMNLNSGAGGPWLHQSVSKISRRSSREKAGKWPGYPASCPRNPRKIRESKKNAPISCRKRKTNSGNCGFSFFHCSGSLGEVFNGFPARSSPQLEHWSCALVAFKPKAMAPKSSKAGMNPAHPDSEVADTTETAAPDSGLAKAARKKSPKPTVSSKKTDKVPEVALSWDNIPAIMREFDLQEHEAVEALRQLLGEPPKESRFQIEHAFVSLPYILMINIMPESCWACVFKACFEDSPGPSAVAKTKAKSPASTTGPKEEAAAAEPKKCAGPRKALLRSLRSVLSLLNRLFQPTLTAVGVLAQQHTKTLKH